MSYAARLGKKEGGRFGVNNSVVALKSLQAFPLPHSSRARILPSPNLVSRVLSWRKDAPT